MSNELDLSTTQETLSSPLASPVNSKPTDETTTATSDSESTKTLSVGNGNNKSSESQIQNKRKNNQTRCNYIKIFCQRTFNCIFKSQPDYNNRNSSDYYQPAEL